MYSLICSLMLRPKFKAIAYFCICPFQTIWFYIYFTKHMKLYYVHVMRNDSAPLIIAMYTLNYKWRISGGFQVPTELSQSELCHQTIPVFQLRWLNSKFRRHLKTAWDLSFITHSVYHVSILFIFEHLRWEWHIKMKRK